MRVQHAGAKGAVPEVRLALVGALTCLTLAPVAAGTGWLLGGDRGALSAVTAFGVVGFLAVSTLPLYRLAGRAGTSAVGLVSLLGFGQRLLLATGAFAIIDRIPAISMRTFALALATALVASLAAEITVSLRDPRLSFVDPKGVTG